ncbi:MAG TPA: hypothetical protein VFL57_11135 [Bryobacteraceae bacterium]|nr:hypothetical protein [Bryobacteraceae bacterium]
MAADCLQALLASQNGDGGWSYGRGSSWTEPTIYALLALSAADAEHFDAALRGARWLQTLQRRDGGFPCSRTTGESAWVTGLALLLAGRTVCTFDSVAAMEWVLTAGTWRPGTLERLRVTLFGRCARTIRPDGWSWTPDTASWVLPTSLTILGLQRVSRVHADGRIPIRIGHGRDYLRAHMCTHGGWSMGDGPHAFPETTGAALLAMHGAGTGLEGTLATAERLAGGCRSREGRLWLTLGLAAHGRAVPGAAAPGAFRGTRELALTLIADAQLVGRHSLLG